MSLLNEYLYYADLLNIGGEKKRKLTAINPNVISKGKQQQGILSETIFPHCTVFTVYL
jgi:tRNA U34 5-carboxymethylaminomethyl modifying enzyme MnmG/GidA